MTLVTLLSNQGSTTQTVTLNRLESTAQTFNPTVILNSPLTISLDRLESTAQIYLPTVVLAGGVQTITLNFSASTAQIYLPTINLISAVTDTSDILNRYRKKQSESKEEEEIAAQLLKARQKRPEITKQYKALISWKKLIYEAIYGAETVEELEAIETPPIPSDSPEIVAAILAEIEEKKAARKAELELRMAELELKIKEAAAKSVALESQISARLEEQKQAVEAIRQLQEQVIERHNIAVQAAQELHLKAFKELQAAEHKAMEFTRKRNNRIKRLKALMWLAKIDL
jgi:hypothetical protein